MSNKLTTQEFIEKANKIHGKRYEYINTNYINSYTDVEIICMIHGMFLQTPYKHLIGRGCQKCGGSKRLTLDQFIKKSKEIHGNQYCYDKVVYVNNSTKVKILCIYHGEFCQIPQSHMIGQGCPMCVGKNKTTEEFVRKANIIHGNKYDYSKSIYKTAKSKIIIICPIHGEFNQIPDGHLNGKKGCYKCHSIISKQEIDFLNYLKIPDTKENRQIKILRKKVDGYDPETKTIYEFLGDYWHGNPKKFNANEINYHCKKTFKNLYKETFLRFKLLNENGYNVKYIWECDWENWEKNKNYPIPIKNFIQYI